jgi:transcription initiation factor IIF auxiliary subunit
MPPDTLHLEQSEKYEGDGRDDHWWGWAVWVEGPAADLEQIEYVEYTLHPTFPKPVRRIYDRESNFKLSAGGWGVFTIHAKAVRKDGSVTPLRHDLSLRYPSGEMNVL